MSCIKHKYHAKASFGTPHHLLQKPKKERSILYAPSGPLIPGPGFSHRLCCIFFKSASDYPPTKTLNCKVQIFVVVTGQQNGGEVLFERSHLHLFIADVIFLPAPPHPHTPTPLKVPFTSPVVFSFPIRILATLHSKSSSIHI